MIHLYICQVRHPPALSGDQVRVLYFFCYKSYIIMTHAFTKRTARVPDAQIRRAKACREDFLRRYDEIDLKEGI